MQSIAYSAVWDSSTLSQLELGHLRPAVHIATLKHYYKLLQTITTSRYLQCILCFWVCFVVWDIFLCKQNGMAIQGSYSRVYCQIFFNQVLVSAWNQTAWASFRIVNSRVIQKKEIHCGRGMLFLLFMRQKSAFWEFQYPGKCRLSLNEEGFLRSRLY